MFLNEYSFKKRYLHFIDGDDLFSVDGRQRPFAQVVAFYRRSTDHYTNNVYHGNSLWVGLQYAGEEKLDTYLVDSNHEEPYCLLTRLANAVETCRRERLESSYRDNEDISFAIQGNATPLHVQDNQIFFGKEKITSIRLIPNEEKHLIQFVLPGSKLELHPGLVSDQALMVDLAVKLLPIAVQQPRKRDQLIINAFLSGVVIFGINGWLARYTDYSLGMNIGVIEILSILTSILLAVAVCLAPVNYLVRRWNVRRIARRLERMERMGL